jgi:hypothetical protein
VRGTGVLALGLFAACAGEGARTPDADRPLALRAAPAGDSLRLSLVATPGWKINARVKPVLEFGDGARLRFDTPRLTPDSAYFAEPPAATVPARAGRRIQGTLRASVCAAGEAVCRVVAMEVTPPSY